MFLLLLCLITLNKKIFRIQFSYKLLLGSLKPFSIFFILLKKNKFILKVNVIPSIKTINYKMQCYYKKYFIKKKLAKNLNNFFKNIAFTITVAYQSDRTYWNSFGI